MKKTIFVSAAAVALLSLAACSGNKTASEQKATEETSKNVTYTGILPAADTDGVRYALNLDYTSDNEGSYKLDQTYLVADSTAADGYKDKDSFKTEGTFAVESKDAKKYLKLTETAKADTTAKADVMYFLVDSDSTMTMVNSDLQVSVNPDMNYTLKLEK